MSQIVDAIKGIPGDIIKLPTTIYNFATGSYYGVPVATFGLIGITSAALAYVTLTQDTETESEESEESEPEPEPAPEEPAPEPREPFQMNGGKKTIRKRGKTIRKRSKNKKTVKRLK